VNKERLLTATVIIALLLLAAPSLFADGLTNGNFGTGDFTGWTIFTTSNGTNGATYPYVSSINPTGDGNPYAAVFNVGEVTFYGPPDYEGGGVYQDFTTSGGLATLGFDWAAYNNTAYENADGGQFSLLLDGSTVASYDTGDILSGQTIKGSFSDVVSLTPGSHEFEILIERPWLSDSITPKQYVSGAYVTTTTIPEPGTLALLGTGLFALGNMVRKRKQQKS
jgi:hypothetical protein